MHNFKQEKYINMIENHQILSFKNLLWQKRN